MDRQHNQTTVYSHLYLPAVLLQQSQIFYATAYYYNAPKWQKIKFFIHIFSPHTSINFSYIQKGCSNRYSPVVAAELSLLHVTVLDSGFATLCFHKCALMVNNFIEFAHFWSIYFLYSYRCNIAISYFTQKTFLSLCSYRVRSCKIAKWYKQFESAFCMKFVLE